MRNKPVSIATRGVVRGIIFSLVVGPGLPAPFALAQGTGEPAPPTFSVGTADVLLDVVVRDKKGNLVRDLKASDFEVYEDGKPQTLDSFQVISKDGHRHPSRQRPPPPGLQPASRVRPRSPWLRHPRRRRPKLRLP